jgi:hypothetical protein
MNDLIELTDREADDLMARLRQAFSDVECDVPLTRPSRRSSTLAAVAAAAIIVVAGIVVASVVNSGSTPAWAAEPRTVSAATQAAAIRQCAGEAGAKSGVSFVAFDARGLSTLAVFEGKPTAGSPMNSDGTVAWMSYVCLVVPGDDGLPKEESFFYEQHGERVMTAIHVGQSDPKVRKDVMDWAAWGPLVPGAVRVELRVDGQAPVVASMNHGHYALWWWTPLHAAPQHGSIVQLDANGSALKVADTLQ